MPASAAQVALAFSKELQKINPEHANRQRWSRRLLKTDPIEQIVPGKLLGEGLQKLLDELAPSSDPGTLFMDRAGGGEGAKTAAGLMPLIGNRWSGASLVFVSFSTPSRGVGVLARSVLVSAAAKCGVEAHVVAYNRPADGMEMTEAEIDALAGLCKLVITYTPGGFAGLAKLVDAPVKDPLIGRSHLAIQSYPDPESLVGDLSIFGELIDAEPAIEAIRFTVQIQLDGRFEALGETVLGPDGDAEQRLWALLENATKHRYRILMEPLSGGDACGDPVICPCRTLIEENLGASAAVERIVPAGSRLVAVARGKDTLL